MNHDLSKKQNEVRYGFQLQTNLQLLHHDPYTWFLEASVSRTVMVLMTGPTTRTWPSTGPRILKIRKPKKNQKVQKPSTTARDYDV